MRTFNKQVATDVVLNANRTSNFVPLKSIVMYSMAVNITGTPTGTIRLQGCNDPETNDTSPLPNPQAAPVNWADISNSTVAVTTQSNNMYNVRDVTYNYVRVVFTDGSSGASTATMDIIFNGKGI